MGTPLEFADRRADSAMRPPTATAVSEDTPDRKIGGPSRPPIRPPVELHGLRRKPKRSPDCLGSLAAKFLEPSLDTLSIAPSVPPRVGLKQQLRGILQQPQLAICARRLSDVESPTKNCVQI